MRIPYDDPSTVSWSCRTAGVSSCSVRSRVDTAVVGSERRSDSRAARSEYSSRDRRFVVLFLLASSALAAPFVSPLDFPPLTSLFPWASRPVSTWSGPSASRASAGSTLAPRPVYGETTLR